MGSVPSTLTQPIGEVGVREAAQSLGLSEVQVRRLIASGTLPGRRVAGRWVTRADALLRLSTARHAGRPFTPRHAWAFIALVERGEATDIDGVERSRLRARLRGEPSVEQVSHWTRRRARTVWLRGHSSAVDRARSWPGGVPTGASAPGHDVIDVRTAELFVPERSVQRLQRALQLRPAEADEANIVVHVPSNGLWPFIEDKAGPATVALDLFDSGEPRSRRASRGAWEGLLRARRWEPAG